MKIRDLRSDNKVGISTLRSGEVFQFCHGYYIVGEFVNMHDRQCTDLNNGTVIDLRISEPETMVTRIPKAKLVIED